VYEEWETTTEKKREYRLNLYTDTFHYQSLIITGNLNIREVLISQQNILGLSAERLLDNNDRQAS